MDHSNNHTIVELLPIPGSAIEVQEVKAPALILRDEAGGTARAPRPASDRVNRFLLCGLVFDAVRKVKASAERSEVRLPVAEITRKVLRSYLLAAEETRPPAQPESLGLKFVYEEALIREITRQLQDRIKTDARRYAKGERREDKKLIKAEKDDLEPAVITPDSPASSAGS